MAKQKITSSLAGAAEELQEFAGIPDSPIFTREREQMENPLVDLHVGGVRIGDLPIEAQNRIVYQQTDEAMEERNARPNAVEPSGISLGADPYSKQCEQRKDDIIDRGMEPWEAANPMKDLADAHVRPGFRPKFLSPNRVDKDGTRGYEVVRHPNGEPVKLRNMLLGQMPEERVKARNKFYSDKAKDAVGAVKRQYMADGGQTAVDDKA